MITIIMTAQFKKVQCGLSDCLVGGIMKVKLQYRYDNVSKGGGEPPTPWEEATVDYASDPEISLGICGKEAAVTGSGYTEFAFVIFSQGNLLVLLGSC